jgi:hypothetical protein
VVEQSQLGSQVTELDGPFFWGSPFQQGEYSKLVKEIIHNSNPPLHLPIIIRHKESLGGWLHDTDPTPFQLAFRSLFHFSKPLVDVGKHILTKLPAEFFGVHLRVESAWPDDGGEQMQNFLDIILAHNSSNPLAYVACGEEEKLATFTALAKEKGVKVVHKWTLLDGEEDKQYLKTLQFDQLGIIDRVVLEKATFFYGVGLSSYSFMLGMERHVVQFGNLDYRPFDEERQYLFGQAAEMWLGITW